tara:strand:+ start:70 stop:255 length:186 start_codon:yes stop_codon:yes gene_type:complete
MTLNEFLIVGFVICLCTVIFGTILEKKDKSNNLWGRMVLIAIFLGLFLVVLYGRLNGYIVD